MKKGKIFIISGPAGVGKDTIIKGVMKNHPSFVIVKSYTTRPTRKSDEVGNRIFVSVNRFKKMIADKEMIEWAKVHSWYYGRRKDDIVRHIQKGNNVIMDVDVLGAVTYEKIMPEVISIFICYEDISNFTNRLRKNRPEITDSELKIRRQSMIKELTYQKYYDHKIINPEDHPEKAIQAVEKIIAKTLTNHTLI